MTSPADLLSRFDTLRVAVIGDVMLDHFLVGQVDRISPEAPVPVVRFSREEFRLGGAANVANNIAALGGRAALVGLVGDDEAAARVRRELQSAGIDFAGLVTDPSRPTTRKVRVVTARNQQVARVDYEEDGEVTDAVRDRLIDAVRSAARDARAIVLSDYRKGVVSPAVIEAAVETARGTRALVLVDPKVPRADRYRGVTLITPNHYEAELMTQMAIREPADVARAARQLHMQTGANVLITWGEHGMWVLEDSRGAIAEEHLPAAAREVADVTGAGDTVIAVLAMGLAAGGRLAEAARLANHAAGIVVGRFGPSTVSKDELMRQ